MCGAIKILDAGLFNPSLKKEDTSTEIDKLITYHATFEDERGTRHTLTFDMPKFVDEKFIYINGSNNLSFKNRDKFRVDFIESVQKLHPQIKKRFEKEAIIFRNHISVPKTNLFHVLESS